MKNNNKRADSAGTKLSAFALPRFVPAGKMDMRLRSTEAVW